LAPRVAPLWLLEEGVRAGVIRYQALEDAVVETVASAQGVANAVVQAVLPVGGVGGPAGATTPTSPSCTCCGVPTACPPAASQGASWYDAHILLAHYQTRTLEGGGVCRLCGADGVGAPLVSFPLVALLGRAARVSRPRPPPPLSGLVGACRVSFKALLQSIHGAPAGAEARVRAQARVRGWW
jgi:hypothetical protein